MRILLCPDKYKGSLSAPLVVDAMAEGVSRAFPHAQVDRAPMADGGDGTVDAFLSAAGGRRVPVMVTGPLGIPIQSFFGLLPNGTAVIEMAAASGLSLVPADQRNPMETTSYGTGQLIKAAILEGAHRIIMGIGGSATNDGGMGMLAALGMGFFDAAGGEITAYTGGDMLRVAQVNTTGLLPQLSKVNIQVACDVTNPLTGPDGASHIFGPQKGATPQMIQALDEGLGAFGALVAQALSRPYETLAGAGAAGGMGGALYAIGGELCKGTALVMDAIDLESRMALCDMVLTGEGATDTSTLYGKVPHAVGQMALAQKKPCYCISGSLFPGFEPLYHGGITAAFSILNQPMDLEAAFSNTAAMVSQTTENLMRVIAAYRG
ncbi:glycerate kinase [Eubacteriales bacterium OttesenSCG-928-M02]|nr:glycerate kinase [Eubacteriales bacterium OttesenSCG-928-M02]